MRFICAFMLATVLGCSIAAAQVSETDSVVDVDGNVYHTVTIGNQVWMVENLKTTHYNDGTSIDNVPTDSVWNKLTTGAYCWFKNDSATNRPLYGALYNWYAMTNGKLCPTGWHVPNDTDWTRLTTTLGSATSIAKALQEAGTTHWVYSGGYDSLGFCARPGGARFYPYGFLYPGQAAFWWCSNMSSTSRAWMRDIMDESNGVERYTRQKIDGFSIRCIKDDGIVHSPEVPLQSTVFNPNCSYGTLTDVEGNVYKTVVIGTQRWMAENLRTTHYNDGTPIFYETVDDEWAYMTSEGYCWYNNDSVKCFSTYGALYNWYAVNTSKLAPAGWHVPSDSEWTVLIDYLGGGYVAGGGIKETDTTHWSSPNSGATDSSGFAALPAGFRSVDGVFAEAGYTGYWSSVTENSANFNDGYCFFYDDTRSLRTTQCKNAGFSVRCVCDVAVSVKETLGKGEPAEFSLLQNYPNPFNPSTRIQYTIARRQPTIVKVYDVLGREVATLVNEVKEPGTYAAVWNASGMASGVYFCRLTAGSFTATRKLVLMK